MSKEKIYPVYELLKSINRDIHRNVGVKLGFKEVNPSVIAVMILLRDGKARTLKELSIGVGLANSTVSGIVDKLVNAGMLQRLQDEGDRRKVLISLTKRAEEMHNSMEEKFREYLEEILETAEEGDIEIVLQGLTRLNEIIKGSGR